MSAAEGYFEIKMHDDVKNLEFRIMLLVLTIKAVLIEWQSSIKQQYPLFDKKTKHQMGQDFAWIFKEHFELKKSEQYLKVHILTSFTMKRKNFYII